MSDLLNDNQQKDLLDAARRAITHYLETRTPLKLKTEDPILLEKRGAFVTLKIRGKLRGCIGYPLPYKALIDTVCEVAVAAASQDFRFEPLRQEELQETEIEISVLTLPQPVKEIKDIKVGQHGIIISKGMHKGLLLPQVPVEYGWDLETYLRHGCLKAGLDEEEWKKGARIEVFSAQVFSE
jgi:AmmeMemoRadiSam system protein A